MSQPNKIAILIYWLDILDTSHPWVYRYLPENLSQIGIECNLAQLLLANIHNITYPEDLCQLAVENGFAELSKDTNDLRISTLITIGSLLIGQCNSETKRAIQEAQEAYGVSEDERLY